MAQRAASGVLSWRARCWRCVAPSGMVTAPTGLVVGQASILVRTFTFLVVLLAGTLVAVVALTAGAFVKSPYVEVIGAVAITGIALARFCWFTSR